jgi:hypothetical protein
MTTSVKTVAFNLQNIGKSFATPKNNDANTQYKSMSHGSDFNKYQSSLKKKATYVTEGFNGHNTLTNASQTVLDQTDMSAKQQELTQLQQQYAQTQNDYNSLLSNIASVTENYVERVDPSNPYLNKFIKFNSGQICYVTNLGIAKLLSSVSDLVGTGVTYDQSNIIQLDFPIPDNFFTPGSPIPTTPQLISGSPIQSGKLLLNAGENVLVDKVLNNTNSSYVGCYINNVNSPMTVLNTTSRDYESCKTDAIDNGYQYFALQDNSRDLTPSCGVTNDLSLAAQLGSSYKVQSETITWSTNISAGIGSIATLLNTGVLVIYNATNQVVYSTPGPNDSNYWGCYDDKSKTAIPNILPGKHNLNQCYTLAKQQKATVYGLQNVQNNGKGTCVTGSDIDVARHSGLARNCITLQSNNIVGGGLSNAVYSVAPGIDCFMIVLDNGNLVIKRGAGPQDDQGFIWRTDTAHQIQDKNPAFTALKGKYGKNWISANDTLALGDFVGSPSGTAALVMGKDGNLKLTTWKMTSSCNDVTGPSIGSGANAIYATQEVGIPANLGKYGYIDTDYKLYSYPNNVFDPPLGVTQNVVNIDSNEYSKYAFGGSIGDTYGLAKITSVQRQQLNQLETTLNLLSQQINTLNDILKNNVTSVNNQLTTNSSAREKYMNDITSNATSEANTLDTSKNIQNMLNDSDITALQKNYTYILFSIFAAASILVAMNVIKNK